MGELAKLLKQLSGNTGVRATKETIKDLQVSATANRLIQEEYLETAIKGAKSAEFMRKILPVLKTVSNRPRVTYLESARYGAVGSYRAEAPIFKAKLVSRPVIIRKIWTLPLAPEEIIKDGDWNVLEWEIEKAGASIENTLNRDMLIQLIDNASYSVQDASGDPDYIFDAYDKVASTKKMTPDIAILHPKYYAAVLKAGMQNFPELPGPKIYILNEDTKDGTSGTKVWGYTDSDDVGGVIFNSSKAGAIVVREDITVEKYRNPLHDLRGAVVYARYGTTYLNPDAVSIIYK